jgi:hypothetical protein
MSAHFAIPATTFVLRAILQARLKSAYGGFSPPPVSIEPPPRPPGGSNGAASAEPAGLILYLHHAAPNGAWRNMHDPHLDPLGKPLARPPLVLDLHYMLAAQGLDLEREAVLGVAMSAFHRNGIVPRPMIQALLGAILPPPTPPGPAKLMDLLTGEPLADPANQPESITVSQQALDIDLSTKLWSALQSPLRPSAFYLVTTVFLQTGEKPVESKETKKVHIAVRPSADPDASAADDALSEYGATGP